MKLRVLFGYARPYRQVLIGLALLTVLNSAIMLALPWLAGHLLGSAVAGVIASQRGLIALLVGGLVVTATLSAVTATASAKITNALLAELRQHIFQHVQRLPLGFHESRGKGDTLALLTYEISRLSYFLASVLPNLPARLLTAAGAVVLMFRIDAKLALIVPLLVPAFYLILKIVGRRLRLLAVSIQRAEANVVAIAEEMLEMLPATKAFTRESSEADRYRIAAEEASELGLRQGRIYAWLEPIVGLVAALAAVATLLLASRSVHAGSLTAPQLFSFIFYAALLTRPISSLADIYGQVQTTRGTLERMQSVLDQPTEDVERSHVSSRRAEGAIAFEGIVFAYPGRSRLFDNVTFAIEPGQTVALQGPNGSGKTAIINLLLRYYEPQGGRITIDGVDIRDFAVADLRRQIGLVPQTPMLFNASIRDNIAFGASSSSESSVEDAARQSQAWDFISRLPHGLDTMIGDRGVRLSGGQRQRIALARALIKDPPILVFDEATSMFDDEGEAAFVASAGSALAGRTVIIVTHRPATLALAERTLVVADGNVREVANNGLASGRA